MTARGRADYYEDGGYNAVCYECGRKRKASYLRRHWQGYYVCPEHWEPRQPQDFVSGVQDVQTVPWAQNAEDVFTGPTCTPWGMSAIPNWAIPGCGKPKYFFPGLSIGYPNGAPNPPN
jgi:hypothetical protein